jgi:hypothetical protein
VGQPAIDVSPGTDKGLLRLATASRGLRKQLLFSLADQRSKAGLLHPRTLLRIRRVAMNPEGIAAGCCLAGVEREWLLARPADAKSSAA